jgi:hypothetical protein
MNYGTIRKEGSQHDRGTIILLIGANGGGACLIDEISKDDFNYFDETIGIYKKRNGDIPLGNLRKFLTATLPNSLKEERGRYNWDISNGVFQRLSEMGE